MMRRSATLMFCGKDSQVRTGHQHRRIAERVLMYLPRPLDRVAQLRRGEVLGAADVEDDLLAPRDEVDGGGALRDGVGGGDRGAVVVGGVSTVVPRPRAGPVSGGCAISPVAH